MQSIFRNRIVALVLCLGVWAVALAQTDLDKQMQQYGLVDVTTLDSTFKVELRYATTNNFVGVNMYGTTLTKAWLTKETANALVAAQKALRKINPGYTIIIYDAARPQSVQRTMWNTVKGTSNEQYVASPGKGGTHNFGVAVDVTLMLDGKVLDMGTPFDSFSTSSHITQESTLVRQGKISAEALKNRQVLRKAMTQAGFKTYSCEWWHFEKHRKAYARQHLKLLNF